MSAQEQHEMAAIRAILPSKEDMYEYITKVLGEKLPPLSNTTMTDIKRVLCGNMKTLKVADCLHNKVEKFPEFTVKKAYEIFKNDVETMKHLPTRTAKEKHPDRDFVFDVLQHLKPEYMSHVIKGARQARITQRPLKDY